VSIVWELTTDASSTDEKAGLPAIVAERVPQPRQPREHPRPTADVYDALDQIGASYATCREKADVLLGQGPFDDVNLERGRRDRLVRLLHQMHELRHQRNTLLDVYDLPSTAGRRDEPGSVAQST
jgi:hypothetical protein